MSQFWLGVITGIPLGIALVVAVVRIVAKKVGGLYIVP